MADYAMFVAGLVLLTVALGLLRVLRGPSKVDRLMAVQLLGSGGVAVLLLLAFAMQIPAVIDVALTLGLLAAFISAAFALSASDKGTETDENAP